MPFNSNMLPQGGGFSVDEETIEQQRINAIPPPRQENPHGATSGGTGFGEKRTVNDMLKTTREFFSSLGKGAKNIATGNVDHGFSEKSPQNQGDTTSQTGLGSPQDGRLVETEEGTFDDYLMEQGATQQEAQMPQSSMEEVSRTVQGLTPESKERLSEAEGVYTHAQGVLTEMEGKIGQEKYTQLENAFNEYIDRTGDDFQQFQSGVERIQEELDIIGQNIEDIANEKIDPDRYISNMSNTQKIAGAMMAFMEGVSNSFDGKQGNFFIENLHGRIQQDIQLQERDLAVRREAEDAKANLLRDKLQTHGNMYTAKKALEAETLASVLKKIESKANADSQGLFAQRAELLMAEGERKLAEINADTMSSQFQLMVHEQRQQQDILDNIPPENIVSINGQAFAAMDRSSAEEARQFTNHLPTVMQNLREMKNLVEDEGFFGRTMNPYTRSEINAKRNDLIAGLERMQGRNFSRDAFKNMVDMVGNPASIRGWQNNLKEVEESLKNRLEGVIDSAGLYNLNMPTQAVTERQIHTPPQN